MANPNSTVYAGRIVGSPLNGLCERVCIEVPKVFDGCVTRVNGQTFTLDVHHISADAQPPFRFVGASACGEATFAIGSITPCRDGSSCIAGTVNIPVLVTFCDANNTLFSGTAQLSVRSEFNLRLPRETLVPYQIRTAANLSSNNGNFLTDDKVIVNGCYIIVTKVIVNVDLLVPSYGYCAYPQCVSCGDDPCNRLMDLPLFPLSDR